jgi:hypothetical protein
MDKNNYKELNNSIEFYYKKFKKERDGLDFDKLIIKNSENEYELIEIKKSKITSNIKSATIENQLIIENVLIPKNEIDEKQIKQKDNDKKKELNF